VKAFFAGVKCSRTEIHGDMASVLIFGYVGRSAVLAIQPDKRNLFGCLLNFFNRQAEFEVKFPQENYTASTERF